MRWNRFVPEIHTSMLQKRLAAKTQHYYSTLQHAKDSSCFFFYLVLLFPEHVHGVGVLFLRTAEYCSF